MTEVADDSTVLPNGSVTRTLYEWVEPGVRFLSTYDSAGRS